MNQQSRKTRAAGISVASNASLVVLKLIVGTVVGSVSIISEAIHSGVDLVAAIIALFAVRTSGKPADKTHNFGHGKVENIAGTIEAILIFVAAIWIVYEAVGKLLNPSPMEEVSWGVAVMMGSAFANIAVSQMLFRVGRATDSIALQADAWHLRTDVYTSLGVMAGLLIYWLVRYFEPGVEIGWIDPVAAIAVALLIVKAAWELTVQSARDLLDASLPRREEKAIAGIIRDMRPRVLGFHHLRTRKSGHHRFVEFHLLVDPGLSVKESHDLSEEIEEMIKKALPETRVTVHVEPCDESCSSSCQGNCFLKEAAQD